MTGVRLNASANCINEVNTLHQTECTIHADNATPTSV